MAVVMPDLAAGLCMPSPRPRFPPAEAWTSADPVLREAAVLACGSCEVLALCRAWAISPEVPDGLRSDGAEDYVVAGLTRTQRRAARNAVPAPVLPVAVTVHAGLAAATATAPAPDAGRPCACGCGELTPGRAYARGRCKMRACRERARARARARVLPCACGCGELVTFGDGTRSDKRFVDDRHYERHRRRRRPRAGLAAATATAPAVAVSQLCACGCNALVVQGSRPGKKFATDACRKRQQRRDERADHARLKAAAVAADAALGEGTAPAPAVTATVTSPAHCLATVTRLQVRPWRPVRLVPLAEWPGTAPVRQRKRPAPV